MIYYSTRNDDNNKHVKHERTDFCSVSNYMTIYEENVANSFKAIHPNCMFDVL